MRHDVAGVMVDLDGTLYDRGRAIPGAAEAIRRLREAGVPLSLSTNTTRMPRSAIADALGAIGVEAKAEELFTAPVAAAQWLASQRVRRVSLLLPEETFVEFADFERDDDEPEAVVVGDLGPGFTFGVLNRAFLSLRQGARLVALHKNRCWDPGDGLRLDAGPFVAALEFATGTEAVLVGKPNPAFFETAAASLGILTSMMAVVGDSLENEVWGPQAVGALGIVVRTGVFEAEQLAAGRQPDAILDSVADLPDWLGID